MEPNVVYVVRSVEIQMLVFVTNINDGSIDHLYIELTNKMS